ncbi:twisted gastrulation protein homolog 1-A-like [Anneissia japonica]|uniref:twisted gastrulation protein homolog 1-A-like n=1 Tax=Anneissia japonica TaxID=1529436 RepID=UPI001425B255|nr:twisted gastrulation protein homolog 1-A-like [Anneissia japonica]XP_033118548.1 twisted gastrulation protein homolog 1-A-like [Anneissia japonica]
MKPYMFVGVLAIALVYVVLSCNEHCAPIVTKCQLIGACGKCLMGNCSCCANCTKCLGGEYFDCCDCVGLCKQNNTHRPYHTKSTVMDVEVPIPSLFDAIIESSQDLRISVHTLPVEEEFYKPKDVELESWSNKTCVVAFLDECLSQSKCENACISMGASRIRWFHNACCECMGYTCESYGKNYPHCRDCDI